MSLQNSLSSDPFDLNAISLRKPLVFPDGTVQDTAYTGDGSETIADVLTAGNNAGGQSITNLGSITVGTAINLTPTGNTVSFNGEINQVALGQAVSGNQMNPSVFYSNTGGNSPNFGVAVCDNGTTGLRILPNATNNAINPFTTASDIVLASTGPQLFLGVSGAVSGGLQIASTSVILGSGGTGDTPSNYFATSSNGLMTLVWTTGLQVSCPALPAVAGGASGAYLPVNINGTTYKIALLSN